jgi:hypothetical protein
VNVLTGISQRRSRPESFPGLIAATIANDSEATGGLKKDAGIVDYLILEITTLDSLTII